MDQTCSSHNRSKYCSWSFNSQPTYRVSSSLGIHVIYRLSSNESSKLYFNWMERSIIQARGIQSLYVLHASCAFSFSRSIMGYSSSQLLPLNHWLFLLAASPAQSLAIPPRSFSRSIMGYSSLQLLPLNHGLFLLAVTMIM